MARTSPASVRCKNRHRGWPRRTGSWVEASGDCVSLMFGSGPGEVVLPQPLLEFTQLEELRLLVEHRGLERRVGRHHHLQPGVVQVAVLLAVARQHLLAGLLVVL